jgi:diguanylate cyclase (GGDEF)-like protein
VIPTLSPSAEAQLARSELQKAQLLGLSSPELALEHLRRGEKFDPKNTDILVQLGRVQISLGQIEESIVTLERLRAFDPENSIGLALLAYGYCHQGLFDTAKERAQTVLLLDPGNVIATEVTANCFAAETDYKSCLSQLDQLMEQFKDVDLARISFKAAFCYLRLGFPARALDITSTLVENGYDSDDTSAIYHLSQNLVRAEIEQKLQHMTWLQRLFNRLADKALLHLHVDGAKGMDGLRMKYEEVTTKYEAVANEMAQVQVATNQLKNRVEEATRLAHTDKLTGLPNRTCFESEWIPKIVARGHCAFVAFDLDRFKMINDMHGHDAGDKALMKAASIASEIFRCGEGNCFRIGGEEFVAVLFDPIEIASQKAKKFQESLERRGALELAQEGLRLLWNDENQDKVERLLTASVGVACWPKDNVDIGAALNLADRASYHAKHNGRNSVVVWNSSL